MEGQTTRRGRRTAAPQPPPSLGIDVSPYPPSLYPTDLLVPNDFNPNKVTPDQYVKLKLNVMETWNNYGTIPPIVTRTHDKDPEKREIIDGYHRWKILRDEGVGQVPILDLGEVPRSTAQRMCITLNYLRGEPEPKQYARIIEEMMEEGGLSVDDVSMYLPESADALADMLAVLGAGDPTFNWGEGDGEDEDEEEKAPDKKKQDPIIEITFQVPLNVAVRVEEAKSRLYDALYDASDPTPPDVDGALLRLTSAYVERNIKTRDDLFHALRTECAEETGTQRKGMRRR